MRALHLLAMTVAAMHFSPTVAQVEYQDPVAQIIAQVRAAYGRAANAKEIAEVELWCRSSLTLLSIREREGFLDSAISLLRSKKFEEANAAFERMHRYDELDRSFDVWECSPTLSDLSLRRDIQTSATPAKSEALREAHSAAAQEGARQEGEREPQAPAIVTPPQSEVLREAQAAAIEKVERPTGATKEEGALSFLTAAAASPIGAAQLEPPLEAAAALLSPLSGSRKNLYTVLPAANTYQRPATFEPRQLEAALPTKVATADAAPAQQALLAATETTEPPLLAGTGALSDASAPPSNEPAEASNNAERASIASGAEQQRISPAVQPIRGDSITKAALTEDPSSAGGPVALSEMAASSFPREAPILPAAPQAQLAVADPTIPANEPPAADKMASQTKAASRGGTEIPEETTNSQERVEATDHPEQSSSVAAAHASSGSPVLSEPGAEPEELSTLGAPIEAMGDASRAHAAPTTSSAQPAEPVWPARDASAEEEEKPQQSGAENPRRESSPAIAASSNLGAAPLAEIGPFEGAQPPAKESERVEYSASTPASDSPTQSEPAPEPAWAAIASSEPVEAAAEAVRTPKEEAQPSPSVTPGEARSVGAARLSWPDAATESASNEAHDGAALSIEATGKGGSAPPESTSASEHSFASVELEAQPQKSLDAPTWILLTATSLSDPPERVERDPWRAGEWRPAAATIGAPPRRPLWVEADVAPIEVKHHRATKYVSRRQRVVYHHPAVRQLSKANFSGHRVDLGYPVVIPY
jgi:hypothetical protein